jgi:hypothetical protein
LQAKPSTGCPTRRRIQLLVLIPSTCKLLRYSTFAKLLTSSSSQDTQHPPTAIASNASDHSLQERLGGSVSPVCDICSCHRGATEGPLVLRKAVVEPPSCQADQAATSQWGTPESPRELEPQTRPRHVTSAELQPSENDESFNERRASAPASDQQAIRSSPTTTFYRGLQIEVLEGFSLYADILLRNQMTAIDQGLIYRVEEPTQAYIVGWLSLPVHMACIQLVLPSSSTQDLEKLPAIPICLVKKHDSIRAGLVLVPVRTCWRLSRIGSKWIDLGSLEESYRRFLEEYMTHVSSKSLRANNKQLSPRHFSLNAGNQFTANSADYYCLD